MKYLYVYKIENLNNGKLYIGCSGDVQKRIFSHKTFLAGGKHTNEELQADYDKGDKFKAAEIFAAGVNDSFDDYIFGCAMRGVEAFYTVTLNTDLNGYNKKHVGGWRKREEAEICFPDLDGLSAEMRKHAAAFRRYGWGDSRLRKVEILYDYERKTPADYTPFFVEFNKEESKQRKLKSTIPRTIAEKNAEHCLNFKNIAATFAKAEAERIAEIFRAHGVKPSEVLRGAAAALLDGEPIRTEAAPLIAPQAAGDAEPAPAPVEDDGATSGEE